MYRPRVVLRPRLRQKLGDKRTLARVEVKFVCVVVADDARVRLESLDRGGLLRKVHRQQPRVVRNLKRAS